MPATTRVLLLLVALTGWPEVARAGETGVVAKSHVLFMGVDVDLQQGREFRRVENVQGGSFIVRIDGRETRVPMKFTSSTLKIVPQLKLSDYCATVTNVKVERAYSPGADPNRKFAASLSGGAADAAVNLHTGQRAEAQVYLNQVENAPLAPEFFKEMARSTVRMDQTAVTTAVAEAGMDVNSAGYNGGVLAGDLAQQAYDALEVTFEIASDRPLTSAYLVIVAQFAEAGAKPNEVRNWIYATELDSVDAQVHRVRLKEAGFPPGFQLKDYQLHLYNRGQEIGSTVAPKRVELTRDEAFDYMLLDYLAVNKGRTLPATLALGHLSADIRNHFPAVALYVKVSKDGLSLGVFADEACAHPVDDPALEAAVRMLRFKPALKAGKAVDGVARLGSA